jgi:hypothetical protein
MKKKQFIILLLALAFVMPVAMATITYYFGTFSMSGNIAHSAVYFTSGDDTSAISGTIGTNETTFTATGLPMVAGVDIIINEAVNITNGGGSAHSVTLALASENFGSECTQIKVTLVDIDGTEYDAVVINDAGTATTSSTTQSIPAGEEWAVKIEIHLDDDAGVAARTITLTLSYT